MTDIEKAIKTAMNEIKFLELAPEINGCEMTELWKEQIEIWKTALSALEKQIPKKPLGDRYPWCICPICCGSVYIEKVQEHIQNEETTYCEHCGQALDWSDSE